jgi:ketosteroid isomerase-like protein
MSQLTNVEIVQRAIDALNRGDIDAAMRLGDPEVEVDWSRSRGLIPGIHRGHEAARAFWSNLYGAFESVIVLPEEFIEHGQHVLVPNRTRFRGREGIEVDTRSTVVVTLRNDRILRWQLFQEKEDALEAVGLEE